MRSARPETTSVVKNRREMIHDNERSGRSGSLLGESGMAGEAIREQFFAAFHGGAFSVDALVV